MTEAQISDAVITGTVSTADAMREVISRIPSANQAEVSRLNAMQSTLANMERSGANIGNAGAQTVTGQLLGSLTFAYVQAAKVVRSSNSGTMASAGSVGGDVSRSCAGRSRTPSTCSVRSRRASEPAARCGSAAGSGHARCTCPCAPESNQAGSAHATCRGRWERRLGPPR